MIRRMCDFFTTILVAGVLYSGCLTPAEAQNPTCPTRPAGDSSNACASTAFVQQNNNPPGIKTLACTGIDDTALVQAAITALPASGGTLYTPSNVQCVITAPLSFVNTRSVTLSGGSNKGGDVLAASTWLYTGTASPFIDAKDSGGFRIDGMNIQYSSLFFTGVLVDVSAVTPGVSVTFTPTIFNSFLGPNTGRTGSATLVSAGGTVDLTLDTNYFYHGAPALLGEAIIGQNVRTTIRNSVFAFNEGYPISHCGVSWVVDGNSFEPTSTHIAAALTTTSSFPCQAGIWSGNFFGDVTVDGGTWIDGFFQGTSFIGNEIAGPIASTTTTGIKLNSSSGVTFSGNRFELLGNAINCVASNNGIRVNGNYFTNVTTSVANVANCSGLNTDGNFTPVSQQGNAQIMIGQTGADPLPKTVTGCTLTAAGAFSCPASAVTAGAALTKTDDTNITLTLGGSPTTALLAATSITVGWTGTLAAARLNSNVVQSIVNDTNVTGSISAQALTLGWTGTLAAARLNSNVVQAITNDTNITGSISAQNLTLAWAGTLANSRLAPMTTNTVKVNITSGTASPTDQSMPSCSSASSAITWVTNNGFACNTSITANTATTATTATNATNVAITDDTTTNATMDLAWVTTNTGNLPLKVSSTKLNFNPSTGTLSSPLGVFSTSVSSPIHLSSAALTFQSNGSTFAGNITTGQQWFMGSTSNTPPTNAVLTISKNSGVLPNTLASSALQIGGADGTAGVTIGLQSFNNTTAGGQGAVHYFRSRGTAASPAAVQSGDILGANFGFGYATSGGAGYVTGGGVGFTMVATDNYTTTVAGGRLDLYATPTGSATLAVGMSVGAGVMVGTTTDPGAGGLTVQGSAVVNLVSLANVATTSSLCYNTANGRLTYNGTVGTCTVSDERLKNVEGPIGNALDKLLKIKGVYFTWKDPTFGKAHQLGVTAQAVERSFPELVSTDSTGRKSADYQRLTAPIIEAIRELKASNDNLQSRIVSIESRKVAK